MANNQDILFEELAGNHGSLGVITLNRPQALNALNHAMIKALYSQLQHWEINPHIKAVIIQAAEGRAFCAGGDIRSIYEGMKTNNPNTIDFFRDEYQLNQKIYHYSKPYISFLDGITMGGGVGISIHGSHRIATEQLVFAMPETGIGFFPDVGGTYFLPRLPLHMGFYLGLTGAKIHSDDCVELGIANQKTKKENFPFIIEALLKHDFTNDAYACVSKILAAYQEPVIPTLHLQSQEINFCFAAPTMEEIINALKNSENKLCRDTVDVLLKKSPTSLKVTLKALQVGKILDFDRCMQQEYRLVSQFLKNHDFAEGIRAVIIDKDQSPNWQPAKLQDVTQNLVDSY